MVSDGGEFITTRIQENQQKWIPHYAANQQHHTYSYLKIFLQILQTLEVEVPHFSWPPDFSPITFFEHSMQLNSISTFLKLLVQTCDITSQLT